MKLHNYCRMQSDFMPLLKVLEHTYMGLLFNRFHVRKTEELNCLAVLNTLQSAMTLNDVVLTAVVRKYR